MPSRNRKVRGNNVKRKQIRRPFRLRPEAVIGLISILFIGIIVFVYLDSPDPYDEFKRTQEAKPAASNGFFDFGPEIALLALLAFSLWGNFSLYKKGENKSEKQRAQQSHRQKTTFNRDIETNLERKVDSLEKTIKNLERELSLKSDENDKLTKALNDIRQRGEIETAKVVISEEASTDNAKLKVKSLVEEEMPIKKRQEKFYFETPYAEGLFDDESKQPERKFRCIYFIKLDGESTGELSLEPDQKELSILRNYSDTILKPVCEYTNQFDADFQEIQVLKVGRVVKDGSDWVVKEKLQIAFN